MAHPLDRPVWSALTSRQAGIARGDRQALAFDADYGLFAATADAAPPSLAALAALIHQGGQLAVVETDAPPPVPGTTATSSLLWQMVVVDLKAVGGPGLDTQPLTEADAAEMQALSALTRPGPFFRRTHELGDFVGVREAGRLVAMAGERMKPEGFTEVSGVCTHPDHRGRGYAGALMSLVAARILARGETPFLHAYAANTGAIGLYQALGFALRREMTMTMLNRVQA